jgi:DNA-binding Xre family transcriptional regulator
MNIRINLDVEMAKSKISLKELSQRVGICNKSFPVKNRQGKSHTFYNSRSHLP